MVLKNMRVARDGNRILISYEGTEEEAGQILDFMKSLYIGTPETPETTTSLKPVDPKPMPEPESFGKQISLEPEPDIRYPEPKVIKRLLIEEYEKEGIPRARYSNELAKADDDRLKKLYREKFVR